MSKKNLGPSIDDFLRGEGIFEEAQAQAVKEVVAWKLAQAIKKKTRSEDTKGPNRRYPSHSQGNQ